MSNHTIFSESHKTHAKQQFQEIKSKTRVPWLFIREYIFIAIGLLLYVAAWKGFLLPHKITGGGATGVGAILYYATGIPVSVGYFSVNFILLLIAIRIIGWKFSLRTVYGVVIMTLFFAIIPEATPGTFIGENDTFMACLIGGILSGVGVGVVFLSDGSCGGTDIIARVINKYKNVTMGRVLIYCDVLIICSSYFFKFGSLEVIVYGICAMAITNITVDAVINGVRQSVQFFIYSKEYEEIADRINLDLHRGVTVLDGIGWYSKEPVKVLNVMARKNESVRIFRIVKSIDPDAFVSQSSAIGVYGKGFDVIKSK